MQFYLDASALAKRYAIEQGTAAINHLFARVPLRHLHALNVSVGEVVSILIRKRNAGRISPAVYAQASIDFGIEVIHSSLQKLEVANPVVFASLGHIEGHSINSTDAIILQTALELATTLRQTADDLALVTSDRRLVRAASAEGLATFDPETRSQAELDALIGP